MFLPSIIAALSARRGSGVSIKIMSMVFERYPNGGGEMLLALSLADFAEDDGTRVYPSIKQLAEKTRQSERTVQYQLRKMEEAGWLILVNSGNGGRNQRREYVISPQWIKGADIAPVQSTTVKGATDDVKGANDSIKGCNGLHPHIPTNNPSIPIKEPSGAPAARVASYSVADLVAFGVDDQVATEFLAIRKRKRAPFTALALEGFQREAAKASMTLDAVLRKCVERGWQGFEAAWVAEHGHTGRQPTNADRNADWNARMSQAIADATEPKRQPMKDMGVIDAIS